MQRKRVLLPPPDGPTTTATSPRATSRLASSRTRWLPNRLTIPLTEIMPRVFAAFRSSRRVSNASG